jgi:hypothetical protein
MVPETPTPPVVKQRAFRAGEGYPAVGRKAGEEPGRSAKPGNVTVPGEDAGRNRAFWRLEERALKCGREGQRRLERI